MRAIDPLLLRSFVSVVDARSFAKAAHRLNRTQPALSTHISAVSRICSTRPCWFAAAAAATSAVGSRAASVCPPNVGTAG